MLLRELQTVKKPRVVRQVRALQKQRASATTFALSAYEHAREEASVKTLCDLVKQIERYECEAPLAMADVPIAAMNGETETWTAVRTLARYNAIYLRWVDACTLEPRETVAIVRPEVPMKDTMHFVSHADDARASASPMEQSSKRTERQLQQYAWGAKYSHAFRARKATGEGDDTQDDETDDPEEAMFHLVMDARKKARERRVLGYIFFGAVISLILIVLAIFAY